ncbi:MAG TPA: nuclear transport factor 2 family protein [Jatrophihabitans sp.]|jgi:3-phenylpropionate/cinnamic acid dioxygenase small subunit
MTATLDTAGQGADYAAICSVLAQVARTADVADLQDYMALLTDDIVFEFPANPQAGMEPNTYRGAAEVRAGAEERRTRGMQGPRTHTLHLISTLSVHFDTPDLARAAAYWTYYTDTNGTPRLNSMGQYDNVLRRTADGWKLAHRVITIL